MTRLPISQIILLAILNMFFAISLSHGIVCHLYLHQFRQPYWIDSTPHRDLWMCLLLFVVVRSTKPTWVLVYNSYTLTLACYTPHSAVPPSIHQGSSLLHTATLHNLRRLLCRLSLWISNGNGYGKLQILWNCMQYTMYCQDMVSVGFEKYTNLPCKV